MTDQEKGNSYYDGTGRWKGNVMITVRLNCNDWTVTYYRNGKKFRIEGIEPDSYYFAAVCCGDASFGYMKVVESPKLSQ